MWQANKILPCIVLSYTSGDNCFLCCWCHEYNGVMVAIRYSVTDAEAVIISCFDEIGQGKLGIANVNNPNSIVISGVRGIVGKVLWERFLRRLV